MDADLSENWQLSTAHQASYNYLRGESNKQTSPHLDFLSYEATRSGLTCWFGFCSGVA